MRVLALDPGLRRVGVAVSDPGGVLASPVTTLERTGDRAADAAAVRRLVEDHAAELVVVGLPLSLDGSEGPAAREVLAEVEVLRAALGVPVETHDERFTTVAAERMLREGGRRRPRKGSQRKGEADRAAAAVLLQDWLDRKRSR